MINKRRPWSFSDNEFEFWSPDGKLRVEYTDLKPTGSREALRGSCRLTGLNDKIYIISENCAGPPVWSNDGLRFAVPEWTDDGRQKILVIDRQARSVMKFRETFDILEFQHFDNLLIRGIQHTDKEEELHFHVNRRELETIRGLR